MPPEAFPSYMKSFSPFISNDGRANRLLDREVDGIRRKLGTSILEEVMRDLQIEFECRFRYGFGREGTIHTREKGFRRVKEYYLNKASRGAVATTTITTTDRSVPLDRFYSMRETSMNGREMVLRSLKNTLFSDRQGSEYGTRMTASMEIVGDTAEKVARKMILNKEYRERERMMIRTKTRTSFIHHMSAGVSYSVDLTEVESYEIEFELEMKDDNHKSWLKEAGPSGTVMKSYEIELDFTAQASRFTTLDALRQFMNAQIPSWCSYAATMARDVVYQTHQLPGRTLIMDLFKQIKERMQDGDTRHPLQISKSTLPQVRNITTLDLRHFTHHAATAKADGVRSLLYFGRNYIALVRPPTEFDVWIEVEGPIPYEGLLLDGEFVERDNLVNELVKKHSQGAYYVFDVISPCDQHQGIFDPRDVIERNNYLRTVLPREHDPAAFENKLILNKLSGKLMNQGWGVYTSHQTKTFMCLQLKEYEDCPETPYQAFRSYMNASTRPFKDDGLIFTPRDIPYHQLQTADAIGTLKWKPVDLMTIDFLFKGQEQEIAENVYEGVLFSSKDRQLVPFQGTRFFPYRGTRVISDHYSLVSGAIYECAYDFGAECFRVHRPRNDKEFPNTLEVAIQDWYYINNPITEGIMTGGGYDSIREYDRYRLWETLENAVRNSTTGKLRILDLLRVDPRKDLPHEICRAIDVGSGIPEWLDENHIQEWTTVSLWDNDDPQITTPVAATLPDRQRFIHLRELNLRERYDLLLLDGGLVQFILGDHQRYSDSTHLEKNISSSSLELLRGVVSMADVHLLHRMPLKRESVVATVSYGSPEASMILSQVGDGSVQLLFANNKDRKVPFVYDVSLQTTHTNSDRLYCRTHVELQFEAQGGRSALGGQNYNVYYEWVKTGLLHGIYPMESLWKATDDPSPTPMMDDFTLAALANVSSVTSGGFSLPDGGSLVESEKPSSTQDMVYMVLEEGESPAEYLIDYDEIPPLVGGLDVMILKPILKRFSELPGKLPYNQNTTIRFAREISEITLRDQDYQYIVDELDIGIFMVESDKSSLSTLSARNKSKVIRSRHECKNGFMFIRKVESGKYKVMIPSERPSLDADNPYRKQHGMVAPTDPILSHFIK